MARTQEQIREYMRQYAAKRRASDPAFLEKCREAGRKSKEKRKEVALQESANWRAANKEKISEYNKQYALQNADKIKAARSKRYHEKKLQDQMVSKAWKEKNKEYLKEWNRLYTSKRYKDDPVFALKINQRSRVRAILKSNKKAQTHELLGCSFEELKAHIEAQFVDGMSWQNMGEWHIDHIIPLAAFDLSIKENQQLAFNYKNLQPLWAIDNLKKGAKIA